MKDVVIFTDGGCLGNPGPGGWAAILCHGPHRRELSGGEPATTNNRMELLAATRSLSALKEPCAVTLHTDSQYLRRGITEFIHTWRARGWMRSARKPVKNADLWRELDAAASRHRISWQWIKGHAGHPENERCDQLAAAEIQKITASIPAAELAEHLRVFLAKQSQADPELF